MAKSKIVMVTCYDATFAKICAQSMALDYLLVGDSMGMVVYGDSTTTSVTLDQMVYHVQAVRKGVESSQVSEPPQVIADMPILTYESDPLEAVSNAKSLIKAGAHMVKVEGPVYESVRALTSEGIAVCAHIGLTPQTIQNYKVQGKTKEAAFKLREEALELERAGASLLVIEMVSENLAKEITDSLGIPTIGIGAGAGCSGQVLVIYDLLGFNPDFKPKFLKTYSDGYGWVQSALKNYSSEVKNQVFPDPDHTFH